MNPTVFRESFWNHSMKKWSDKTYPFILNDNYIICFIPFLDVFSRKKWSQKKQKKIKNIGPPHYLRNFPEFTIF